ncbi:MAG TPA: hypothetical protein VMH41_07225 [Mycobacteriales bacterium]|nr:hypothetical protein [Mycobacteriales bacterium]
MRLIRTSTLTAAALIAAGSLAVAAVPARASAPVPSDPYAQGHVGFCNSHGQQITHGSVYDKPFVWRAVSTAAAPQPFNGKGRKATLYAFQPRPGIDAAQWSGDTLTAASVYTNASVPMAQATSRDLALSDFLNDYPAMAGHYIELRVLYSSVDTGYSTNYAASFIDVTGTTWHSVTNVRVNCTAGRAVSPESALPKWNKQGRGRPQLLSPVAAKSVGAPIGRAANIAARAAALGASTSTPSSQPSSGASSQASGSGTTSPGPDTTSGAASQDNASSSGGGSDAGAIAGVIVAVVLVGVGGAYLWRRRSAASGPRT